MKRTRGFSLIETMVTMSMLLVLLGAVYLGFSCGLRFFTRSQALAHLQQEAQSSMDWMVKELSTTTVVGAQPGPNALWFASCDSPLPNNGNYSFDSVSGALMWQKWVAYLPDSTGTRLLRSEVAFSNPVTQDNLLASASPSANLALFQNVSPSRNLTADLESFTASVGSSSIKLTLVLSSNAGTSQVTRIQLDDEVHVGNQ